MIVQMLLKKICKDHDEETVVACNVFVSSVLGGYKL